MGGTKIFVFQLKSIVRTGVIALIGLIVLITLVWLLMPKGTKGSAAVYAPGTYAAQIVLHNKPVSVEVTLSGDAITAIELKDMEAAQELSYPLFKPAMAALSREIIRRQSTDVAPAADSAVTSRILLDAVNAAIAQGEIK
jgi:uncharacterized protein with FMN-binding domain